VGEAGVSEDLRRGSRLAPGAIIFFGVLDIVLILLLLRGPSDPAAVFVAVLCAPFVLAAEVGVVLLIGVGSRLRRRTSTRKRA